MPNFDLVVHTGLEVRDWADDRCPVDSSGGVNHRELHCEVDTYVTLKLQPDGGTVAPLDSAIPGETFMAWWAESPLGSTFDPAILHPAGRTSQCSFTPRVPGHYVLSYYRIGGGSILVHFHVDAAED